MKRILDTLVSGAGLLVAAPLCAAIAVWVRADSPGPILFRQERVGQNQESFLIYKFRTMVDRPADQIDQLSERVVSSGNDARITRAGRVLRACSLDELPQLYNVMKGDMSLVGPRPVLPDQLFAVPENHLDRFSVRPGITGLAQVHGRRGLGWPEQLSLDSEYVRTKSLVTDIKILIGTVSAVFKSQGVYADESKNWRSYLPSDDTND